MDIILATRTSFLDKNSGNQIKDPKKILKNYIFSWGFLVDFIAAAPVFVLEHYITRASAKWLDSIQILKLLNLKWEQNKSNKSEKAKLLIKFTNLFFFLLFYIHCTACIFFFTINSDREWVPPQAKY